MPEQLILPWHEPVPEQTIVFMVPAPVTPPLHEPLPAARDVHGFPPH